MALLISFMSSVFLILDVALIHSVSQDDRAEGGIYWPKKLILICSVRYVYYLFYLACSMESSNNTRSIIQQTEHLNMWADHSFHNG